MPGYLAEAAGVTAASTTGTIELRAMYGGLQAAIGLFAAAALIRPELRRPALLSLGSLTAGLGLARLAGIALDGEISAYNGFATVFELASAGAAAWLVNRGGEEFEPALGR